MGGDPRDVPSRVGGRGRHRAPRRHGVALRTRREVRAMPDLQQRTLALRTAPRSHRSRLPSHVRRPYARSKDAAVTGARSLRRRARRGASWARRLRTRGVDFGFLEGGTHRPDVAEAHSSPARLPALLRCSAFALAAIRASLALARTQRLGAACTSLALPCTKRRGRAASGCGRATRRSRSSWRSLRESRCRRARGGRYGDGARSARSPRHRRGPGRHSRTRT